VHICFTIIPVFRGVIQCANTEKIMCGVFFLKKKKKKKKKPLPKKKARRGMRERIRRNAI
jgi:hypothetical protein